jgi:RNA polymerase sigma factor (sigma-70 family)
MEANGTDRAEADRAISVLYASAWVPLVRLAWLILHDQSQAEEVVQDAFIAIHPRIVDLTARGVARAYLRRSVVNGCRSRQRHTGVERRHLSHVVGAAELPGRLAAPSAETVAVERAEARALHDALRQLPGRQQEVLLLRYYLDQSEEQIADVLGISTGSVKTHAHRGLKALRGAMEVSRT